MKALLKLIPLKFIILNLALVVSVAPDQSMASPRTERLLGGSFYDLSESAVAVIQTSEYMCSGALVGPHHILTAAHCIGAPVNDYTVIVGGETYGVSHVFYNSNFDQDGGTLFSNSRFDLGMLLLSADVSNIKPLPVLFNDPVLPGESAVVIGFGTNEFSASFDAASASVGKAGGIVVQMVRHGMITTSSQVSKTTTCAGDSGGPLLQIDRRGEFQGIIGIVSSGTNLVNRYGVCIPGNPPISNFVNLQTKKSVAFLQQFDGVTYLSGAFVKFLNKIRTFKKILQQAAKAKSIRRFKTDSKQVLRQLPPLAALADSKRAQALSHFRSILIEASNTKSSARAKLAIESAIEDANAMIAYYVN